MTQLASPPAQMLSQRFLFKEARRPALPVRQLQYIEAVSEKLKKGQLFLKKTTCPCGAKNDMDCVIAEKERYGLPLQTVLCLHCGSLRFGLYLDERSIAEFYTNDYQNMYGRSEDIAQYIERQKNYGQRILETIQDKLPLSGNIVEIGCGAGGALGIFQQAGYRCFGTDYSNQLVEAGCSRGLSLYTGTINSLSTVSPELRANFIYLFHVFEHLNDPIDFLKHAQSLLAQEGMILIVVPNYLQIDQFAYPGGDLLPFLHIAHKYNFSSKGLELLARQAGLYVEIIEPLNKTPLIGTPAPELWALLRAIPDDSGEETDAFSDGKECLAYLLNTEQRFLNGEFGKISAVSAVYSPPDKPAKPSFQSFMEKVWSIFRQQP